MARRHLLRLVPLCTLAAGALHAGRGASADGRPAPQLELPLRLYSPAFNERQPIPPKYTCDGEDVAPPLAWEGVPDRTASFALIVENPEAPDPGSADMSWVHWVVFNIPPLTRGLPEGGALPPGAREGWNDWQRTGYRGPCPTESRHRYVHRLYALDRDDLGLERPTRDQLEEALRPHVLAEAVLVGTYERASRRQAPATARLGHALGAPLP